MDWSGGDGGFTDIVSRFHKGREIFLCHCEQILCHWETDLAPLAPVQGLWLVEFSTLFSKIISCISGISGISGSPLLQSSFNPKFSLIHNQALQNLLEWINSLGTVAFAWRGQFPQLHC